MKRAGKSNDTEPLPKISKMNDALFAAEGEIVSWQAALGCSLAERLEKISTMKNLTTRQLKRLLKDVLTNEYIVSALHRYIVGEFKEPETGEISAATRRRAKSLGLFSILSELGVMSNHNVQSRAVTRSLTRRVEESLPDDLSSHSLATNVCSEETGNHDPTGSFQLETTVEQSPPPPNHSLSFLDKDDEDGEEGVVADTVEEGSTDNNVTNKSVDAEDPDNDVVYSQFLRSLFASPCNSSNCTPNKSNSRITTPIKSSAICENRLRDDSNSVQPLSSDKCHSDVQNSKTIELSLSSQSPIMRWNINVVDEDEDPDDPEFDVMAELNKVDKEDFFYELRNDRGVRVSKRETKNLRADLRTLFNYGTEEQDNSTYNTSRRPSALAMKAYRQRQLQMDCTTTPNQTEKFDMTRFFQSAMPSSKSLNTSVVSIPIRKRMALTSTELVRLERQLGMHIQLLTTSFLLTYDFPDMHESTTRPCASLLKTLVAKRQAFDLIALQKKVSGVAIHSLTSFYWRCPTLDMAVDLISDYSGLSMLPRSPWNNPYNKPGVGHAVNKSQSFGFPIPYCLLDIMVNSPIWSYAYLMPTVLGPHPKNQVRLVFHPSEDALMIMGLADFSGALITRRRKALESKVSSRRCFSKTLKSQNKQLGRYIAYRFIGRYILPHRTFLQLRSRRWNMLANRDSIDNAGDSKPVSLATRYLLQLYKELSQPDDELDLKRMQQYANKMSSLATPYGIPLITACLTDRNPQKLFTFEGLPTEVGYEDVLRSYNNNNCGESVKRKLDVLTEFAQNAKCFWKSQMEKASQTKEAEINYLSVLDNESMIKSEQSIQCDVLGPNYLPAIPVDLNPDGTVVLSRTREPGLVEVTGMTDEPGGSISENENSTNLPSSEIQQHGRVCQRAASRHIEFILARINKRKSDTVSYTNKNEAQRSVADCDILNGVAKPSVSDFSQGEQFIEISNVFESYYNNNNNTGNVALDACQKVADSLVNTFHLGFDRFSGDYGGDTYFSPKKFNHIGWPSHVQPIPDSPAVISDECQSQQAGVFPSACFVSSSRFIARCRARGDATSADLLTLPSSVISQSQTLMDEMDVRRARSLLDRCRTYLAPSDYRCMMRSLMNLNQAVHYPTSAGGSNHDQQSSRNEVLVSLVCVLNCLKNHLPLWEDFVRFLTPSQARSLGLLSTYLNLARIGRVQTVLQDIVPQDRRFWRRLRNLADSCSIKARYMPVKKKLYVGPNDAVPAESSNTSENRSSCNDGRVSDAIQTTKKSSMIEQSPVVDNNQPKSSRFRSVQLKGGDMHDSFTKAWSVLERSWRNRPVLLSSIASLINTRHKPCSGFEQSFEEIDVLARNPIGIPNTSDESNQNTASVCCNVDEYNIHQLEADDINDPHIQSLFSDGWEICTDLSSAASYNRSSPSGTTAWPRRQCPCLCHINVSPNNKTASITNQSGKPAKVDSLGLRHCISCSLRVHRGTLYIDECNLHLRPAQITWPHGFKPKTRLPTSIPSSDALSTQNHRLTTTTMQHTSSISTRVAVNELAKAHSKSYSSNKLSNHCTRVPDMAGRRVAVEYLHTRKPTTSINHEVIQSNNHSYDDTLGAVEIQSPCDPQDLRSKYGYLENPISWTLLDDEAACFNTEAFASVSDEKHECEFRDMDDWTPRKKKKNNY